MPRPLVPPLLVILAVATLGCPGGPSAGGSPPPATPVTIAAPPVEPGAGTGPEPEAVGEMDAGAGAGEDADEDAGAATALEAEAGTEASAEAGIEPGPEPGFLGGDDDAILEVLCNTAPTEWVRNQHGTTIGFRLAFEGGLSAIFKPAQTASHSKWEAEVAAYRLSRFLGINRVPPSCEMDAFRDDLTRAAGVTPAFVTRMDEEVRFARDGSVRGMVMYWVPDLRSEENPLHGDWNGWLDVEGRIPPGREADAAALSDLLLLDWLTLNIDRWSGGNVRRAGAGGPIVFIDNAAGFNTAEWVSPPMVWGWFRIAKRFRRGVVDALRTLTDEAVVDLLGDVLSEEQIAGFIERRDEALARIDGLVRDVGEDTVFVFE